MDPTNEAAVLAEYDCTKLCPHCQRSLCLTRTHQQWVCHCGHYRTEHVGYNDRYQGTFGWRHPHPCNNKECDCMGLVYLTDEDMIQGLIGVVQDLSS